MKIVKLYLYTHQLESQFQFFNTILELSCEWQGKESFVTQIGWTQLIFTSSSQSNLYHYCFLIPSNTFKEALKWFTQRVAILCIEERRHTQFFESWNAESFYFYDGGGNLAECIVHYNIDTGLGSSNFDQTKLLGINEIGMPVLDIPGSHKQLELAFGSKPWKGDLSYFGTHGSEEGRFLLPNYNKKTVWFPTQVSIEPTPFDAEVEINSVTYRLCFDSEENIITERISTLKD